MARGQVQLSVRGVKREFPVDPGMLELRERNGSRFSGRAHERDRHLVRDIECFDQDSFVPLQSGRVLDQDFCELVKTRVMPGGNDSIGSAGCNLATLLESVLRRKRHQLRHGTAAAKPDRQV